MIKRTKKIMSAIIVAMMVVTTNSYNVFAADDDKWTEATKGEAWDEWCERWEIIKTDWTQLSLTPGADATQLNFAWYSVIGEENPIVKVSKNYDMSDAKIFEGNQSSAVPGYVSNKVTVTGLEENSKYYYSYGTNDNWSEAIEFKTQSTNKFGFILVGDPQIGSSAGNIATGETTEQGQDNATRNDTFNWNNTINKALSLMPNASFILSAGDQIQSRNKKANQTEALEYTGNEVEYAGYLSADALSSLPVATSLGNHDAVSGNYSYHFNNPNASSLGAMSSLGSGINGDYYYRYGNTLFIMLNTNNTNTAEHEALMKEAIAVNEDATWRVVTLHQDIYGSAEHSNEPAIAELRYKLVPIFEENNVDIVLTGHDHAYARTQILKGGKLSEGLSLMDEDKFDEIAEEVGGFDFILADLGVSSMQIDNPKRGFSFKVDGPLDLRLNQEKGISAAERLDTISREELAGMLYENSDEPYCEELAKAITEEIRKGHRIDTTTKLRQVIEQTLSFLPENKEKKDIIKKTCQRTFQALRIDVNHEFEVLYEFMEKLPGALKPGGRVTILTFHSGEDKLVKKALKAGYREGIYSDYAKDVVRPSAKECAQNGRARSTKMRWAVKA